MGKKEKQLNRIMGETRRKTDMEDHESESGSARCIGVQTEEEHQKMIQECGSDKDMQDRYLRDHGHLTQKASKHGLPKKKTRVFLGNSNPKS